ncbi:DUF3302 domain-containing protein [Paraburkholderia sp. J67]|uniref:DUF3302 domain-containing protein n=1 Tax=Paraburkholderia sp. J67 TaxID=2805435 RepID=UPI002ABD182C|nr:DUF3302 domain-containing protein [Paraburkholderia sp. J67]
MNCYRPSTTALVKSRRYLLIGAVLLGTGTPAFAAIERTSLEHAADFLSWIVLAVVPVAGIYVFWMLHILPEKVARKKQHPQKEAIHALCLLSLFFGGLLWPLAWLWAHTKPVFYRAAYGTDKVAPDDHDTSVAPHLAVDATRLVANGKEVV